MNLPEFLQFIVFGGGAVAATGNGVEARLLGQALRKRIMDAGKHQNFGRIDQLAEARGAPHQTGSSPRATESGRHP